MGFFQNSVETRELHKKETLRTHYYRSNFDNVQRCLEKLCREEDMQLQQTNKRFGEIYICAYNFEVFVQAIEITPQETAVDFKVNFFSTFGFGRPEKKVIHLYDKLNHMMVLKGVSLHPKC